MAYFGSKKTLLIGLKGEKGDTAGSNPNLLINSNFAINQRGASSYTASNVYTVDRWKKGSGTVTVHSNYLTLSVGCSLTQPFENTPFIDKTMTVTINVNGTLSSKSFTFVSTNSNTVIQLFENGWRLEYSGTSKYLRVVNVSGSANDKLYWAKLEMGDAYTVYSYPLIAEELVKCQRYFYRIADNTTIGTGQCTGYNQNVGYYEIHIIGNYPTTMRTNPTITISSMSALYLWCGGTYFGHSIVSMGFSGGISPYEYVYYSSEEITSGRFLQNWLSGGYIDCDAEIY